MRKAILKWNHISLNTSGHGDGRTEGPFARIGTLGLSQLCSQLLPLHLYVTNMGNMSLNVFGSE